MNICYKLVSYYLTISRAGSPFILVDWEYLYNAGFGLRFKITLGFNNYFYSFLFLFSSSSFLFYSLSYRVKKSSFILTFSVLAT